MTKKVKVILDADSRGRVWLDDQELSNITDITIRAGVDRPTTAVIELSGVNIEGYAEAKVTKKKAKRKRKPKIPDDLETK